MNQTGKVNASGGLHLRQHANATSNVLFTMSNGAVVKIEGEEGNWWKVRTAWGERGYLYKQYVTVVPMGPVEENPDFLPSPPPPFHRTWAETALTGSILVALGLILLWFFGLV